MFASKIKNVTQMAIGNGLDELPWKREAAASTAVKKATLWQFLKSALAAIHRS